MLQIRDKKKTIVEANTFQKIKMVEEKEEKRKKIERASHIIDILSKAGVSVSPSTERPSTHTVATRSTAPSVSAARVASSMLSLHRDDSFCTTTPERVPSRVPAR